MLNPNEEKDFKILYCFFLQNRNALYTLIFAEGKKVFASFDTCCESDNGLELNDPNYEEFICIVMRNEETDKLFEFNYHNMPKEVYCGDKRII